VPETDPEIIPATFPQLDEKSPVDIITPPLKLSIFSVLLFFTNRIIRKSTSRKPQNPTKN
jgi:hypothetical protein